MAHDLTHVMVFGLGITGRCVVEALLRRGVDVLAFDDRPTAELLAWAESHNLEMSDANTELESALAVVDAVVPAPGMPDHHRLFAAADTAGTPVLSEFDLAARWDDRPTIAVTGTDGKTTVVTLIEQMLSASGIPAHAVGNTDTPWVQAIDDDEIEVFVVEASSFRLAHSEHFAPDVAVWLNFGPDHLDAHQNLASYEAAKASIWAELPPGSLAVANRDDAVVQRHAQKLRVAHPDVMVSTFGSDAPVRTTDSGILDGNLIVAGEPLVAIDELHRSLPHDLMNGLAAAVAAQHVGAKVEVVAEVLRDFDGLDHRVQFVAEIDGVRFINDSKATTPHAAATAMGGFHSIVLLAGGKNKGLAFDDMVAHADRLRHVVAIGDAACEIERIFAEHAPTTTASSMPDAVATASAVAQPGDVVLLSPACASFDWYRNYRHRGDDFMQIVRALVAEQGGSA